MFCAMFNNNALCFYGRLPSLTVVERFFHSAMALRWLLTKRLRSLQSTAPSIASQRQIGARFRVRWIRPCSCALWRCCHAMGRWRACCSSAASNGGRRASPFPPDQKTTLGPRRRKAAPLFQKYPDFLRLDASSESMSGRPSDASRNLALCPECQRLLDACLAALIKNIEIGGATTVDGASCEATKTTRKEYEAAVLALNRHRAEHGC